MSVLSSFSHASYKHPYSTAVCFPLPSPLGIFPTVGSFFYFPLNPHLPLIFFGGASFRFAYPRVPRAFSHHWCETTCCRVTVSGGLLVTVECPAPESSIQAHLAWERPSHSQSAVSVPPAVSFSHWCLKVMSRMPNYIVITNGSQTMN